LKSVHANTHPQAKEMALLPFYVDRDQAEMLPQLANHFSPMLYPNEKAIRLARFP
jgi:hypothetical protein